MGEHEPTGERDVTINEGTKLPLQIVLALVAGILALAAQWFDMRMQVAALDAKQTAAIVRVDTRVDSVTASAAGDHRLLCAIARKLTVTSAECE